MTKEILEDGESQENEVQARIKEKVKSIVTPVIDAVVAEATEEATLRSGTKLPPGTAIGRGTSRARKVPWTMEDVRAVYPDITITPEETLPATFNGVTVYLEADKEITVPSVFKGLYDNYRTSMRRHARGNIATPYGPCAVVPGAGPLPIQR